MFCHSSRAPRSSNASRESGVVPLTTLLFRTISACKICDSAHQQNEMVHSTVDCVVLSDWTSGWTLSPVVIGQSMVISLEVTIESRPRTRVGFHLSYSGRHLACNTTKRGHSMILAPERRSQLSVLLQARSYCQCRNHFHRS